MLTILKLLTGAIGLAAIGVTVTSCFIETARWHENERRFCASRGMRWEHGNDKRNGSCIDFMGFGHPISNAVRYGRE